MFDELCWVIKKDNFYVNAKFNAFFTGITTGFTGYSNEETMQKDLQRLGEGYHAVYLNLKDVPRGERIYLEVDNIKDAKFWVCGEVPEKLHHRLTPGRYYGLLKKRTEYYFQDNLNNNASYFLTIAGKFVQ